jgi:phytanoyl-CoA hydroxylase
MEEIRRRYERDGYVWLKRLLPPSDVWNARKDYFEFLSPTGLIKEGTDPRKGIYCGEDWRLVSKNPALLINHRF